MCSTRYFEGNRQYFFQKVQYLDLDVELYLRMPKFDLSTEIKATEVFKDLGLESVFTGNGYFITWMLQQVFIFSNIVNLAVG